MNPWDQRPRELRTLLNPAFCGLLIARAVIAYEERSAKPMPYSLVLLVLPISLHPATRAIFKSKPRAFLTTISSENPEIQIGLAERARGLMPYSMEALSYLSERNMIRVSDQGGISIDPSQVMKSIKGTEDTKSCQTIAKVLGKKIAETGDRATVYTSLGIRP
jgi:Family of unknown function (DUF6521)